MYFIGNFYCTYYLRNNYMVLTVGCLNGLRPRKFNIYLEDIFLKPRMFEPHGKLNITDVKT